MCVRESLCLQCTEIVKPPRAFNGVLYVCGCTAPFFIPNLLFVYKALEYFTCDCFEMKMFASSLFSELVEQVLAWKYVESSLSALEFHCYEFNNTSKYTWNGHIYGIILLLTRSLACFLAWSLCTLHSIPYPNGGALLLCCFYYFILSRIYSDWNDTITKLQPIKGSATTKKRRERTKLDLLGWLIECVCMCV